MGGHVPQFDPEVIAIVAIAAAAMAVMLLILVLIQASRMRAIRKAQLRAFGRGDVDVVDVLDRQKARISELVNELDGLKASTTQLREKTASTVSRIAVVRYDAFDDMGGALSFSAALLDDNGHGMVLSAINGRQETRSYAKGVIAGASQQSLTDEETNAINAALGRQAAANDDSSRRRRRKAS